MGIQCFMSKYLPRKKYLLANGGNKMPLLIVSAIVCAALIPSSIWAEGNDDDVSSSESNVLSTLEKCEIYRSSVSEGHPDFGSDEYQKCENMDLFQPLKEISFSAASEQKEKSVSLTKSKDKNWPLTDLSITAKSGQWSLESPKLMLGGLEYNLSDYIIGRPEGYSNIKVGYSDESIIVQLLGLSIYQLKFTPSHCKGEALEYNLTQVLSWYPPFHDDGYSKTFIKWPCTT